MRKEVSGVKILRSPPGQQKTNPREGGVEQAFPFHSTD